MNDEIKGEDLKDIKLITMLRRLSYLVSKPNYHTTKLFTEHPLAIEMKKTSKIVRMSEVRY